MTEINMTFSEMVDHYFFQLAEDRVHRQGCADR